MATCSSISPVVDCGPYGSCVSGWCVCESGYSGRNDIISLDGLQCTTNEIAVIVLWAATLTLSAVTLFSNLKYTIRVVYRVLTATDDQLGQSVATSKTETEASKRDVSRTAASNNAQQLTAVNEGALTSRLSARPSRDFGLSAQRRSTYDAAAIRHSPEANRNRELKVGGVAEDTNFVSPVKRLSLPSPSTPPPAAGEHVVSISASRKVAASPASPRTPVNEPAADKVNSVNAVIKSPLTVANRPSRLSSTNSSSKPPMRERVSKLYKTAQKPVFTSRLFGAMNNLLIIIVCSIHLSSNSVDNTLTRSWLLTCWYFVLSVTVSTSVCKLNLIFYNLTQQVLSKSLQMEKQRIWGTARQIMVMTTCLRYCSAFALLIPLIADDHSQSLETGVAVAYHGAGVVYGLALMWMYGVKLLLPSRTLIKQLQSQTLLDQRNTTLLEFAQRTGAVARACSKGGAWLFVQELLICAVSILRHSDVYTLPVKWMMVTLAAHQATQALKTARYASKVDKVANARRLTRRWTASAAAGQAVGIPLSATDDVLCVAAPASRRATGTLNVRRATFDVGRMAGDRLISINELTNTAEQHIDAQSLISPSPRRSYQSSADALSSRSLQVPSRRSTATLQQRYNSEYTRGRALTTPQSSFKQAAAADAKSAPLIEENMVAG